MTFDHTNKTKVPNANKRQIFSQLYQVSTTSGLYIASIMAVSGSRNKQLFLMQTPLGGSHIQCAKNIVLCLWYIQLVDYCPQVYVPEIVTLCGINRKFLCEYRNCIVYQRF
ncbi:hypothetical protein L798_13869 [Zootermopsis nevadensis]|uniref:Uncharacterized protein n=1 Tax=Zootermopsis nevadensis TaxID=136037 RepID=A0A067RSC2_ZOONE|nr:hypothetical protein L798_13869 [Zootermopsis nevadensis]